ARRQVGAVACDGRRHDAHAEPVVVALQRDLVVVDERPDFLRNQVAQAEVLEDCLLRFAVDAPVVTVGLCDADFSTVERSDQFLDALGVHRTARRISAARTHSSSVGTSAMRQYPSPAAPKKEPGETISPCSSSPAAKASELSRPGTSSHRYIVAELPATRMPFSRNTANRVSRLRR